MKRRLPLFLGLGVALTVASLLAWPSVALWNAMRSGADQAAAEASQGRFEFVKGSASTSSMNHFYPGTDGCLLPDDQVRVTDWAFEPGEAELARREDAFASSHNRYLIEHFPKQASVRCRRVAG